MKLSKLAAYNSAIEQGVWIDLEIGDIKVKVRGANNSDWRHLFGKLVLALPPNKRLTGHVDPDDQDRITTQCLTEACLVDWKGLEDDDGAPLPATTENKARLMQDPAYRAFRDAVEGASRLVAARADAEQKEIAGN